MIAFAQYVIISWGWRRRLIALASGMIGALAMAPLDFFPALIAPMSVAVWLIDGAAQGPKRLSIASLRAAAAAGWWQGFGFFLAGLWWLGAAFLVEADQWAWALPLGVIALPAFLALFHALGFAMARLIWTPSAMRIFTLAAALTSAEWLRGVLFGGFPWNDYGMAFGGVIWLAQFGSLCGLHGLTLVACLLAASPAVLASVGGRKVFGFSIALFACVSAFGFYRLSLVPPMPVANVALRIMQPNILQDASFTAGNKQKILSGYLALSDRAMSPQHQGIANVTHLIWPESAFPFILSQDPAALAQIGAALPVGVRLIAGAARIGERVSGEREARYYNAIQVVESGGVISASYDKVHLVPFGEYLPFDGLLRFLGLAQFVHIPGGFTPGGTRKLLLVGGLPAALPLICYEAIFPEESQLQLATREAVRPGVLLNLTNDSWFGLTSGPYQHLAQARLRAIEQGLPMIRAANTGISAVIDPYGRYVARLPLGVEGVLDSPLPQALAPTIYAEFGNWIALGMLLAALACGQIVRRKKQ